MKSNSILLVLMGIFISNHAMEKAMEEEIGFTIEGSDLCLKVSNNDWFKELNKYDQVSLGYRSTEVTRLRKEIEKRVLEELNDIKSDIPGDASVYDQISWNIYPLLLFKEASFEWERVQEVPSWKMIVVNMKTKSRSSYFEEKLLFRESNPSLLKLSLVNWVKQPSGCLKSATVFNLKIKEIKVEKRKAKKPQRC